ncbi:MAG: AEC family transporter [Pseudomonadota bacterium]
MFDAILAIVMPVVVCAAAGYLWIRTGRPYDGDFVGRLVLTVAAPCLTVSALGKVRLDTGELLAMAGYWAVTFVLMLACGYALARMLKVDVRAWVASLVFSNVGNMGLPLGLLAFGDRGLALALAWYMVASVAHFSLGLAAFSGGRVHRELLANPIVWSVFVAVLLVATDTRLPVWLGNTLELLGSMTIPLMVFALGAALARIVLRFSGRILAFSVLRIAGGFLAGLLVVELFGLTGAERGIVLIQSTMPVAVFNYLFAQRYGRVPDEVAGLVLVSTLLSFASLPLLLWFAL